MCGKVHLMFQRQTIHGIADAKEARNVKGIANTIKSVS